MDLLCKHFEWKVYCMDCKNVLLNNDISDALEHFNSKLLTLYMYGFVLGIESLKPTLFNNNSAFCPPSVFVGSTICF
jgi:hypothetical protein